MTACKNHPAELLNLIVMNDAANHQVRCWFSKQPELELHLQTHWFIIESVTEPGLGILIANYC